jgi:hypothetical protein
MAVDWNAELAYQLDFYWEHSLRPRLDGLTDQEYLWEPVDGCWSVRPAGDGTYLADRAWPAPDPPPFTTIAWRICHIAVPVLGIRASNQFGDGSLTLTSVAWPGTATAGIALLEASYAAWKTGLSTLDEAGLARPTGPSEGPYRHHPLATLILHISREVMHHGGEIGVLRDLYRDQYGDRSAR